MPEEQRNNVHQNFSDHEKQFAYLPLDVLTKATNIAELVLPRIAKGQPKYVDLVIRQIHKQMPIKLGKWCKELAGLRFVEFFEDAEEQDDTPSEATKSVTTEKTAQKQNEPTPEPEPEPVPKPTTSKPMPKSAKNALTSNEKPHETSRVTRSRKVNFEIS